MQWSKIYPYKMKYISAALTKMMSHVIHHSKKWCMKQKIQIISFDAFMIASVISSLKFIIFCTPSPTCLSQSITIKSFFFFFCYWVHDMIFICFRIYITWIFIKGKKNWYILECDVIIYNYKEILLLLLS